MRDPVQLVGEPRGPRLDADAYHPAVPPRVEYEIRDLGRSLAPLFAHLAEWASAHLDEVE
ncbi:winged helix-turn-helix transcriptional regulator, partial [Saccharothrix sp. MB29]|nr:winged helix-turn-helix transcriptional regulator [Saccharothrix sp. MB29]